MESRRQVVTVPPPRFWIPEAVILVGWLACACHMILR